MIKDTTCIFLIKIWDTFSRFSGFFNCLKVKCYRFNLRKPSGFFSSAGALVSPVSVRLFFKAGSASTTTDTLE